MESVRLSFPALLAALRIGGARHPAGCSAAPVILIFPVEGLLSRHLPVLIHLCVQLLHVRLRRLLHARQLLLVLVRLDVRRIRVQDRSAQEALPDALTQDLIFSFSFLLNKDR